jgi:hypothetical protein
VKPVAVHPAASDEVLEATAWYAKRGMSLGERFLAGFERALEMRRVHRDSGTSFREAGQRCRKVQPAPFGVGSSSGRRSSLLEFAVWTSDAAKSPLHGFEDVVLR